MTAVRREKITLGTIVGVLGFASGVLAGVFGSVKTYGAEVNHMRSALQRHCAVVAAEKPVMVAHALAARERDLAMLKMLADLCDTTRQCKPIRDYPVASIPSFDAETCEDN